MADKEQIIINGVNVSKCDFYDKDKGYCLTLKMNPKGFKNPSCFSGDFQECIQGSKTCPKTFCHNNSKCHFKQLARKTTECEELKAYAQAQENQRETYYKEFLKLSQENKELKRKVELMMDCPDCKVDEYKKALNEIEELKEYIQANKATGICETCTHTALIENDRYRKALKEIKEVCLEDTRKFADKTQVRYDSLDDILDIINKAKDGK